MNEKILLRNNVNCKRKLLFNDVMKMEITMMNVGKQLLRAQKSAEKILLRTK